MNNKSFTLIELLVVIVIIGILAGVIVMTTTSYIEKANLAKAQAFSSNVSNRLWKNLVSEWTFDNSSNLGEDTGGNIDGVLYGSGGSQNLPQQQPSSECVFGKCLKFDGTDDSILADINSDTSNGFTFSAWYVWSGYSDGVASMLAIINNHGIADGSFDAIVDPSNKFRLRAFGETYGTKDIVPEDKWHHVVLSINPSGEGVCYYDGQNFGENTAGMENFSSNKIFIGQYVLPLAVYNWKGLIDDIRIYDKALSISQIKKQYVAGLDSLLSKSLISKEEYSERLNNLALGGS